MAKATSEVTLVLSQEEAEALAGLLLLVCASGAGPTGTRLVQVGYALTAVVCEEAAVDLARLAWVQPNPNTDTFVIRFKDEEGRF